MSPTLRRSAVTAIAPIIAVSMVLAGCSSDDDADSTGTGSTDRASEGASAEDEASYPVTFTTPWGESTLTEKPTRIASLGYKDADVLASLGETPVIMGDSTEEQEFYTMEAMPGEPEAFFSYDDDSMAPIEELAAVEPDLIVASNMDLSQHYDQLSAVAPVIAAETTDDLDGNWQQTTTNLGKALGKQAEAEEVIETTEQTATDIKQEHPEFDGKSISMINYFGLDRMLYLNPAGTDLSALLGSIGFTDAPNADKEWKDPVSEERIGDIAADVIVVIDNSNGKAGDLEDNPLFKELQAAKDGNVLVIHNHAFNDPPEAAFDVDGEKEEGNLAWAVGYPGPLSTQWELTTLAPLLSGVIKT